MRTTEVTTDYGRTGRLADPAATGAYLFAEHTIEAGRATPFGSHTRDHRTFVVIAGRVRRETPNGDEPARTYGYLDGWHALPGCVHRIVNAGTGPAVVIEAGSVLGETTEAAGAELRAETAGAAPQAEAAGAAPQAEAAGAGLRAAACRCPDVSDYTVHKPWGSEVWYTRNLPAVPYALKRIRMTEGHQSSLQSHRQKLETNYVIEGEATVLSGATAPDDLDAVIDMARLTTTVHRPRSGWTNPPNDLHRVIARTDYTSIEISTPELDDVIRWQDDAGRGHGRIESEHAGGRS
jgi:quercetin dioxygenase-like cupin family protein